MQALSIEEAAAGVARLEGSLGPAMTLLNPARVPIEGGGRLALADALAQEMERRLEGPVIRVSINDAAIDRFLIDRKSVLPMILRPRAAIVATLDLSGSDAGGPRDMAAVQALVELADLGRQGAKAAVVALKNPLDGVVADMVLRHAAVFELAPNEPKTVARWRQGRQAPEGDPPAPGAAKP